jgi:hypothetical protein
MKNPIGRIVATEKNPTTIDDFCFWTSQDLILNPFDVIRVEHVQGSDTFGVVEEISHITDSSGYLATYISNDFGDVTAPSNTNRIGMNYVKAKVVGNTRNIYIPVQNNSGVFLATANEIAWALGLSPADIKNPVVCGYLEMYDGIVDKDAKVFLPVNINADFLIGPEGAHLNISGISGLAAKTSYAMFLMKAIQHKMAKEKDATDVAFIFLNVKGRDLLSIDEPQKYDTEKEARIKKLYEDLTLDTKPFQNVKYFYPYGGNEGIKSYVQKQQFDRQTRDKKAYKYKYLYEEDKENLDLMFANIDDPNQTIDSILNYIISGQGKFSGITTWGDFEKEISQRCNAGGSDKEIPVGSWRKFRRIIRKLIADGGIFARAADPAKNETRLQDAIKKIKKNDVFVVDVAKQDEDMQAFVFGDIMRAVYALKLGEFDEDLKIPPPQKIIIFIDELNKYASGDVPKSSPILRQLLDIAERGRSLGIILFSAEQFKSAIHDRITGNCSTHAYGRTNAIEVSKNDYRFVPPVYKNMMTRLKQGEYIIQNPIFRSLLNIKFPEPLYRQDKGEN